MDYSEYTGNSSEVKEYMLQVSDGVYLKIIEFIPENIPENKPVIIFVAGWISLISGWKGVLKVLTKDYRILYLDSREKYTSDIPEVKRVSFSMDRLAIDLGEIIEQVISPGDKFILAGSSLGATAILEYCASGKRNPAAAVLIGPNSEFRFPEFLKIIVPFVHPSLYSAIKPVIKWYIRNFRLDKKKNKEQIEKYELTMDCANPYKLKANALALVDYSLLNRVNIIDVPCLIIGATTDTLHGTENIKSLLNIIPYSEYIELESNTETHSEKAGVVITDYISKLKPKKV